MAYAGGRNRSSRSVAVMTVTPRSASTMMVGVASVDITPPVGIILAGYHKRISTSIGHRLRAEALVCGTGRSRWVYISAETLGFSAPFVRAVRRAIARKTGIPGTRIMLTVTHTHSGPLTYPLRLRRGSREALYRQRLDKKLVSLVEKAVRTASPGTLETTVCQANAWGHNRRVRNADGSWRNEWEDRKGQHRGYFDGSVMMLSVRRPAGHLDGLLVNYGSHPVTLGPQSLAISGDYVSYLKDALESQGVARTVLFGLGGHANINPPNCIRKSPRSAQVMGRALATIITAALPHLRPVVGQSTGAALVPWLLRCTQETIVGKGLPATFRKGRLVSEVMALRAGDLGMVSVPGELFSEYVALIRRDSPLAHTIVLSLGNDYIGYFPTDKAAKEGAYEARAAPAPRLERPLRRVVTLALTAATR